MAPSAVAQGDNPVSGQYVPTVPTKDGAKDPTPGSGNGGAGSSNLSPEVEDALPDSPEGDQLEGLATEERVGAPADRKRKRKRDKDSSERAADDTGASAGGRSSDGGNSSGAVSSTVSDWEDPLVPILAGLILTLALGATVVAVRRRRRTS